jgi:hypothetical protein
MRASNLRKLPRNVVLGAQAFAAFLQRGKVAWSHHARPVTRRPRLRQRSRDLDFLRAEEVRLLVVLVRARVGPAKSELSRLDILQAHALPVKEIAETLGSVSLVDALSLALLGEIEHVVHKLINRVIDTLHPSVDNVDTVVGGILNQLLHVAAETRQVRSDTGHTHNSALSRSVTPRLVVGGENTEMGSADEVVVVEGKNWVRRVQELRVEHNLDAIRGVVEKLAAAELSQDWVLGIVDHVVGHDRWQVVSLHGKQPPTEHDLVCRCNEVLVLWQILTLSPCKRTLKQLLGHVLGDVVDSVVQRLDDGLALEGLNRQRLRLRGQNDERDNCHVRVLVLHLVVQTCQRFDEHVHTLIPVLVPSRSEEVQRVLRIEVVVAVEMSSYEVIDLDLGLLMQVLELMGRRELLDVETVGQDTVWLALQEMFTFVCGDVRDRGEDIGGVRGGALDAVPVVDAALSCLSVAVEVLQVVVEVYRACTQVATEQRSVGGEDGGYVDVALLAQGHSDTGKPLVELDNDGPLLLVIDILHGVSVILLVLTWSAHLAKEPRNEVSKDNRLVGLRIARRRRDACGGPQVALPLVEPAVARASVEKEHSRRAVNEPTSVERLDAALLHRLDCSYEGRILWFYGLDLDGGLAVCQCWHPHCGWMHLPTPYSTGPGACTMRHTRQWSPAPST